MSLHGVVADYSWSDGAGKTLRALNLLSLEKEANDETEILMAGVSPSHLDGSCRIGIGAL